MECNACQQQLIELLYNEVGSERRAALEAHINGCETCRADFESLKQTMGALDSWTPVETPFDADRFTHEVETLRFQAGGSRSGWKRHIAGGLMGVAASLFLGVCVVLVAGEAGLQKGRFTLILGPRGEDVGQSPRNGGGSQFLMVLYENPPDTQSFTLSEMRRIVGEYGEWAGDLERTGHLLAGEKLTDDAGRTLLLRDDEVVVLKEAQRQADDHIGGFFQIRAGSLNEAVQIAQSCPHLRYGRRIELREINRHEQ